LVSEYISACFWPWAPAYRWHHRPQPLSATTFTTIQRFVSSIRAFFIEVLSTIIPPVVSPFTVTAAEETKMGTATINVAIRNRKFALHVDDWKMKPQHIPAQYFLADTFHP
jgi:hypothetical protein